MITLHSDLLPMKTKAYFMARAAAEPFHQLPDECPRIMYLYRLFLYTGTIFSKAREDKDEMDGAEHNDGASMDAERTKLMECYVLGVHLHDERFRNAAINALVDKVEEEEEYPTGLATDVYQHTVPGDRLRRLIVDFHVWKGRGSTKTQCFPDEACTESVVGDWLRYPHEDAHGPPDFLADVAAATKKAGTRVLCDYVRRPWEFALCMKYHEHFHTPGCIEVIDLSDEA